MDAVNLTVSFWKIVSKSNIIFKYYDMKHYRAPTKIYLNVSDECKIKQWFFGSVLKRLTKKGWIFSCQHFIIRGYVVHTPIQKFNVYPVFLFSLCQYCIKFMLQFSSVQSLSRVQLFAIPWTAAHQASLSITNSQSLLKLVSITMESVMPSNHLIICRPLLLPPSVLPSIRIFSSESPIHIRWPKFWSFSVSISPSNEYSELFPLGLSGLISLQSKGLSRVFSNTTVQKHKFSGAQLSL